MRDVINISLPKEMAREVKKTVANGQYSSTSEFFRSLLRAWMEEQLVLDVEISRKEFAEGKGKKLRSLKDLR